MIQDLKGRLLRDEGRSGTVALVGAVKPVGAELDPAVAEVEDRRVREVATGGETIFISRAINPKVSVRQKTLGMSEQHDPDCEGAKPEIALIK